MENNLEFSNNKNLVKSLFDQLLKDIFEGNLKPGQIIFQNDIANKYNISRTTVREAIQALNLFNIVRVLPGKGVLISEINLENLINPAGIKLHLDDKRLKDFWALRLRLELWALEISVESMEPDAISELENSCVKMTDYKSKNLIDLYIEEDFNFHMNIIKAAKNEISEILIIFIREQLRSFIKTSVTIEFGDPKKSSNLHLELLKSIINRDTNTACYELTKHLNISYELTSKFFNKT
jgi:GntR family transcriptional repressor for pyruvate dehydrogenase complex